MMHLRAIWTRLPMLAMLGCCAVALWSCGSEETVSCAGRVLDAGSGLAVDSATLRVQRTPAERGRTQTRVHDGWYVLENLLPGDTVRVTASGFHDTSFVVDALTAHAPQHTPSSVRRDVWLAPVLDTAWTADGPVDAAVFLEGMQAVRKKLSVNETRMIARRLLPGARIRSLSLIEVGEGEEWMVTVTIGHAEGTLYINALSGALRSAESEDHQLDRRLQDLLREQ